MNKGPWLSTLLLAAPLLATAADPAPEQRFLADPHLQQNVLATAARSTVMLRHACQDATYKSADPVEVQPMKFNEFGSPTAGELRFPVTETGCGASRQLNVRLWVQHESSIAMTPMLPGSSRADSGLQQEAWPHVMSAAGGPDANCKDSYIEDTRSDGAAPKGKQPWKEVWTLNSCSWRAEVPVTFTPDPSGTKITAGPKNAVKKQPL